MPNPDLKSTAHHTDLRRRPSRRRLLIRWLKRGVIGLICVGIVAMVVRAFVPEPLTVDVATIARGSLEVEIVEDGRTRVRERYLVTAPIAGELERIELEAGTAVTAGTVIARLRPMQSTLLDPRTRSEAAARVNAAEVAERQAQTAIARARAARDVAVREAERARQLEQRAAIPTAERERAELAERLAQEDLATAELQRRAAQAEIAAARAVLVVPAASGKGQLVELRAPTTGVILRVHRDSAGLVAAGTPLIELGDLTNLEVVIDVLSSDAASITPGMAVRVSLNGSGEIAGTVRLVEPAAFTRVSALGIEEQRVNVIATLSRPPPSLGDGFRVDASIITWRGDDVILAPASALFRHRGQWAVYAIATDKAQLRPVEVGHRGKLAVEIKSGLGVGDQVVAYPSDRIADATLLRPREPGP